MSDGGQPMNRYLIKFTKQGLVRYTSHLDMMRLFQRAFKRGNIRLAYSSGFSPHPKISFAHPLSLGFTSSSEYLEIVCAEAGEPSAIQEALNRSLPHGIHSTRCKEIPEPGKTMASLVRWASYRITLPGADHPGGQQFLEYIDQPVLIGKKRKKGSKELVDVDMKPLIHNATVVSDDASGLSLDVIVSAGSSANLNPEVLLQSFLDSVKRGELFPVVQFERTELHDETMISLWNIFS
jgi:radical SAM-linked protein